MNTNTYVNTHTYVIMKVSKETYEEVARQMVEAGYNLAFLETREGRLIDMHGLALKQVEVSQPTQLTAGDLKLGAGDDYPVIDLKEPHTST